MSGDADTGEVEVRVAKGDDVRAVRMVAQTTWEHTYHDSIPERVREEFVSRAYSATSLRLRMESNAFLIALQDGNVVGFADFRPFRETRVELEAIYVLPEMQGCGIETRLLEAGIARFSPGTELVLRVERDNARALRFYESNGFRRSGEFTERLFGHDFHDVEMVLPARKPGP